MELLPDYAALIEDRIAKRDGTPLLNGTLDHAMMIIQAMFSHAVQSVKILTGTLNARVYGNEAVISAARQFLANPDHRLEIVFEEKIEELDLAHHPLLAALEGRENLQIWRVMPEYQGKFVSHFALMDDDSYRFEADKSQTSAVAAFGDKKRFKQLDSAFASVKKMMSTELRVPALA
jgi:hypothetical protein